MQHIYLIRHGETDWNRSRKMQGILDIPLNNTGKAQALLCAKAFFGIAYSSIFTSPLSRAVETAEIISQNTSHAPIIINPDLIERDYGLGTSLFYEEIQIKYPLYPSVCFPGMEDFQTLSNRIFQAVSSCCKKAYKKNILIISHGGSINAFLSVLSDGKIGTGKTILKNTCICDIVYQQDINRFSILNYNVSPEDFSKKRLENT